FVDRKSGKRLDMNRGLPRAGESPGSTLGFGNSSLIVFVTDDNEVEKIAGIIDGGNVADRLENHLLLVAGRKQDGHGKRPARESLLWLFRLVLPFVPHIEHYVQREQCVGEQQERGG